MRHLLPVLLVEVLVAAPPAFEVVNRCPAFEVTNKVPPPPAAPQPEPPSVLVREYHPQLGGWVLVRRPAPGVAGPQPFRGGYHAGHDCPACGRAQFVISGGGPVPGTHAHACAGCGTGWYH